MISADTQARILELLRGSKAQRDRGLQDLYTELRAPLYSLALRMTGRADLADDAVQETFVDILRASNSFRGDARLTTWIFRIAVRASTRVASRARAKAGDLPDDLPSAGSDPALTTEQLDGAARILRAIASLPAPQRAVLALSALDGLPQVEIASILGVPEGTVYSRLHSARAKLRELLDAGQ